MGLFKSKAIANREIKDFDEKISVIYDNGIQSLPQSTGCEMVLKNDQLLINPLSGPERKIVLDLAQINSVSLLPWGEYALKFLHTSITIPKNSPGREYVVIAYTSSEGVQQSITFWGSAIFLKMQKFVKKLNQKLTPQDIHL